LTFVLPGKSGLELTSFFIDCLIYKLVNDNFNFMLLSPLLEQCQGHSFLVCLCACICDHIQKSFTQYLTWTAHSKITSSTTLVQLGT